MEADFCRASTSNLVIPDMNSLRLVFTLMLLCFFGALLADDAADEGFQLSPNTASFATSTQAYGSPFFAH